MRLNILALTVLTGLAAGFVPPPACAQFTAADIGNPTLAGSSAAAGNGYNVTGAGADIAGTSDQFQFNYTQLTGDFDVRIRVQSFNGSDVWAKAGLMAREDLSANTRYAGAFATPGISGSFFQSRIAVSGQATNNGSFPSTYPNTWLRLRRAGVTVTAYGSIDGSSWQQIGSMNMPTNFPNVVYVGMAVTSRKPGELATGEFRDFANVANNPPSVSARLEREPIASSSRKTALVISEIMYHPRATNALGAGLEFIEIFNTQPWDERIGGYRISGSVDYLFPTGTVIKAGSYLVVARDKSALESHYGISGVMGPWDGATTNNLPGKSGTVRLRNRQGAVMLEVNYEGRNPWPIAADGAGHSLVLARPSYGEGNPLAWTISDTIGGSPGKAEPFTSDPLRSVVINEFLAHTEPTGPVAEDYVELYNHSNVPVDLSGALLTDEASTIGGPKGVLASYYRIPNGTAIPPHGLLSFGESTLGFGLSANGERIYLVNSNETRVIDGVDFEPQLNGVSYGRSPDGAADFYPMATRTPGAANSAPRVSPVVINEIMYNPISGNSDDEYVELYNRSASPMNIGGWRFTSGISFSFASNTVIAPGGYLVVAKSATNLLARYPGTLTSANTVGDFDGKLAGSGERLALSMPDLLTFTNATNGALMTNVIYAVVNEVTYGDGGRWGNWSDGGGSSLELVDPESDNRQPANWADSDETGKGQWSNFEFIGPVGVSPTSETLSFAGDRLQIFMLGVGECLIDEVEVRPAGGANIVVNPGFESGTNGWLLQGSHDFSTIEDVGFAGARSLHIRAASRGDNGANRIQTTALTPAVSGGSVTMRAKARWVRGWPEVLLRLRGGGAEAFGRLPVPANLGTPGAVNSRHVSNTGPAIYNVQHFPPLPQAGENVVVTAKATDPNGVAAVRLKYRLDSANFSVTPALFTSVTMVDDGTGGDAVADDGIYSGTIPGRPGGGLVSFYVEAVDGAGATNVFPQDVFPPAGLPRCFPNDAPTRECVVRWGDTQMTGNFPTYHLWLSSVNSNRWHIRKPELNNASMDGTFVLNNYRVVYNALPLYAGSPWHRGQMQAGPAGASRADYVLNFPVDDQMLGATDFVINNPGNPSGTTTSDHSAQTEQTSYFIFNEIGLVYNHRRYVHVFVNGSQRSTSSDIPGNFIMEDSQQPNSDMIAEWFPDDTDGELFKIEDWFEFPDDGFNFVSNNDADVSRRTIPLNGTPTLYPAPYRFMFRARAVSPGESANNYTNFFSVVDAASPSTNFLVSSPSNTQPVPDPAALDSIANIDQWMRIFAVQRTVGNWDSYGYSRGKNDYTYKPKKGRFEQMTWDIDFTMGVGGNGSSQALFDAVTDPRCTGMYSTPVFTRMYYRAFQDIVNGPLNPAVMNPVLDAKQAALVANRVNADNNVVTTIKVYAAARRTFIIGELNKVNAKLAVFGTNEILTGENSIVLRGSAPFTAQDIYVNGVKQPVTWTATSLYMATNWTMRLVLNAGTNVITIQGYDQLGRPITNAPVTVTAVYTGAIPDPVGSVVFNEIQYNPANPSASFVELYNRSSSSFDVSGWRINGLDYIFPIGSVISNGQYVVLVKNRAAFGALFGGTVQVFDAFDGNLDLDGETLTLIKPGATSAGDVIINKVRYEASLPWPSAAAVSGSSLQLIDAAQDNARVSNWGAGFGWQRISRTGNIVNGTNLLLWLAQAGNGYVDDISLIGPAGTNIVINGGFESGSLAPWIPGPTYSNSIIVSGISHSGSNSLFIQGSSPGGSFPNNLIQQIITDSVQASNIYTLSFYALYNTNSVTVNMRPLPGNNLSTNLSTAPIQSTPGAANLFVASLPPYDSLWLNEVQPNNTAGIADNFGQMEPWIELYNGGTGTLDLSGYYLATNYTSGLTLWPFPAGSSIGPREFKIIWADGQPGQTSGTNLHTSFRISPAAGSLALVRLVDNAPQITDYLNYRGTGPAVSYGDYPDGQPFNRIVMFDVTPGATNRGRNINVFINEWMAANTNSVADPADGDFEDWFELFNAGADTIDLGGYFLTDDLSNRNKFMVPTNGQYRIPPGGFLLVWADGEPGQNDTNRVDLHANFNLRAAGEVIGLFSPDGTQIDAVTFTNQLDDISEGRYADGAPAIYVMTTPTPRGPNTLGGGNNNPPILDPIADRFISAGQAVSFTAGAHDPDAGQTLTFSLAPGFPPGAMIHPSSGQFLWTTGASQSPGANSITVRVTDNGVPQESATQAFVITVAPPPSVHISGNVVSLSFPTIPGKTYRIEFKNDLNNPAWTPLVTTVAAGSTLPATDTLGANPQRFYHIVQLD